MLRTKQVIKVVRAKDKGEGGKKIGSNKYKQIDKISGDKALHLLV
jgi:hypothetical protein